MSLDAEVGGAVELGPLSLNAIAGLGASFDGMATELKKWRNLEKAYQFGSVEVALRGSGVVDSNGDTLIIDLGGPTYGRLWQLRRIIIGGVTWDTMVGGAALVVQSANQPSVEPPLPDIADSVASLPSNGFYSTGQVIIRHPNHLFVLITGPDETVNYSVGGQATDMPDSRHTITTPD